MTKKRGNQEFTKSYQPKLFSEMTDTFNKDSFIRMFEKENRPRAWLFKGSRGCGKTTLAKIFSKWLNCSNRKGTEPCLECESCQSIESGTPDVMLLNMADKGTLEDARRLIEGLSYNPAFLKNKVVILDEAHQMTKQAQESLLAELDKGNEKLYLILCTMTPQKIEQALVDRCTGKLNFDSLTRAQGVKLILEIYKEEGLESDADIIENILKVSNLSPRDVTSKTQAAINGLILKEEEEFSPEIGEIAQKIMNGNFRFLEDLKNNPQIKAKDIEGFRIAIAGYFRACLNNSSNDYQKAFKFAKALDYITETYYANDAINKLTVNLFKACSTFKG
jgi:DNA polymerase III subunit gamma/tau